MEEWIKPLGLLRRQRHGDYGVELLVVSERRACCGRIEDHEGLAMGLWSMNECTEAQIDG